MATEKEIKSMKLEMINAFYFEIKQLFYEYFEGNLNNYRFNNQINHYFDNWNVSRLDLRNTGTKSNSIKSLDKNTSLKVKYPKWLDNGRGCVIESKMKNNILNFKCNGKGKLILNLKGVDFRNSYSERVPIFIIYKKLIINDELILNDNTFVWHDKQYTYRKDCDNNEKINVQIMFETIFDHFPELLEYKNKIIKALENNKNIKETFKQLKKYIVKQKNELSETVNNETFLLNEYLDLTEKFEELTLDFNEYKKNTNKILDSYNILFDSIFKYHTVEPKLLIKQSRELNNQLLDFIDNICKKYNLKWWLNYGTLIGAVRHDGNIPWDDDYDICMMRNDYDKFFEVIRKEIKLNKLNKHIFVNFNKKGPNNTLLSFMKFEFFDNKHLFGFIDIIPYDYVNKDIDNSEYIFHKERHKFINGLKKGGDRDKLLNNYFKVFNVSKTKTKIIRSGIETVTPIKLDYNKIFPLKTIRFDDRYYPVPNDGKEILKQKYGSDFMKVPKTVHHHNFFDALSRHADVFETFEKNIALLQEVNSKLSKKI